MVRNRGTLYSVDRELMMMLLHERNDIFKDLQTWQARDGRDICPVPLVPFRANRVLSQESAARSYGIGAISDRPLTSRQSARFRTIRAERNAAESDAFRRVKESGKD